jgi:hypothetical protein
MGRVSIVVENEIGVSVTVEPARNLVALLLECGADGRFGTVTVIPRRGCGNVAFVFEAFPEFRVSAPYMLAEGVAPGGLVWLQGVMWLGSLNGRFVFDGWRLRARDRNGEKQQDED